MLTNREAAKWLSFARTLMAFAFLAVGLPTQAASTNPVEVIVIQGTVEIARAGQSVWKLALLRLAIQPSARKQHSSTFSDRLQEWISFRPCVFSRTTFITSVILA